MQQYRPQLDLTKPEDARRFFREYRGPDGKPIVEVMHFAKGVICTLLLNDREVCESAIYFNHTQCQLGVGYFVREELH